MSGLQFLKLEVYKGEVLKSIMVVHQPLKHETYTDEMLKILCWYTSLQHEACKGVVFETDFLCSEDLMHAFCMLKIMNVYFIEHIFLF